jgi:hypothetical protein
MTIGKLWLTKGCGTLSRQFLIKKFYIDQHQYMERGIMKIIKQLVIAALVIVGFSAQAIAEGMEVSVARAQFAQSIEDREPQGRTVELSNNVGKVYFFTELRGMNGKSVTHRWVYGGEPRAAVTFNVGSNRWRVWSSKNLQPEWTGLWTVSVVDEEGNVLAEESLNYVTAEVIVENSETEMVGDAPAQ